MPTRPRALPEPAPAWPPPPPWARPPAGTQPLDQARFLAGAALAALHPVARDPHPLGCLWRKRLALGAAAAVARLCGRAEDAETLRDHFCLTRGGDPGPAGRLLLAWRLLATGRENWPRFATLLELPDEASPAEAIDAAARGEGDPVVAAAAVAAESLRRGPRFSALALWLADAVLARRLGWPAPVPLIAAHVRRADLRLAAADGEAWPVACHLAYARAAIAAADLHADLVRRSGRLLAVAPRLRSRQADAIVARLIEEDALAATAQSLGSDRAQRRLFERLVGLGGVRELTGRASFRLYGL